MLSVFKLSAYFCARASFGESGAGGGGSNWIGRAEDGGGVSFGAAPGACTSRNRAQARRWLAVRFGCDAFNTATMPAKYAAAFEEPTVSSPVLNRARESEITTS